MHALLLYARSRAVNPAALHCRDSWAGVKKYAVVPSWRWHRLGARRCAGGILHEGSAMGGAMGSATQACYRQPWTCLS